MPPNLHVEIDLGVDCIDVPHHQSMDDFELRSALIESQLSVAFHTLRKLNVLLLAQASASTITPQLQHLETLICTIRSQLSILAHRNKSAAGSAKLRSSSLTICVNRFIKLAADFTQILVEFEKSRDRFRYELADGIRTDLERLHPSLTETDIDDAMRKESNMQALLHNTAPDHVHQVDDLMERNIQLTNLNHKVAQLHEIFVELSFLTEIQQSLINDSELNIETAAAHVTKVDNEIAHAARRQKSFRTKLIIAAIIVALITTITVILVVQLSK